MTMKTTISGWCDRGGHRAIAAALVVLALLVWPSAAVAQRAGSYAASRFDIAINVVEGGDLEVSETITFEFQSGTFKRVWREIPAARTDGIQITQASMDGHPLAAGDGPGRVKVSGRNRVKIEWQFDPVGPSTHTFEVRYRAKGVVFRDGDRDVVRWRLFPSEHKYRIAASRTTIAAPAGPADRPALETRRVGSAAQEDADGEIAIIASDIASNGWIIAEVRYPAGRVIASVPSWQQRHDRASALAPRWTAGAAALFVAGIVLLAALRQGYPRPSVSIDQATTVEVPEPLPAALAAVLAARGGTVGYQSAATIFDLADRGVLVVRELPRSLGVRSYELSQVPGTHGLEEHEQEALTIAFAGGQESVSLSKARARLARSSRRFAAAVNRDLGARGYLDPARRAVRERLMSASVVLLIGSALGSVAMATLIPRFEGWPFLLPLALCAAGIIGIVMAASTTSLSDQGLIQAARWRGFKRYLKSAVEAKGDGQPFTFTPRWIVYGIAVGLAAQWARYLKVHPGEAPRWFQAATRDESAAFAAFVGSQSAASGGAGGSAGGGGGAAGGGSSGAG